MRDDMTDDTSRLPTLRRLLNVFIGNTLIAVLLWASGPSRGFGGLWVISQCIGLSTCFIFSALEGFVRERYGLLLTSLMAVLPGFAVGVGLAELLGIHGVFHDLTQGWLSILRYVVVVFIFTLAFGYYFNSRMRILALEQARREAELREATGQKTAALAELRLLQAQIEPHFLFNTLANLHSLIGRDDTAARQLLERLNDYLRASLVHSRAAQATLGDECDMLYAYLAIQAQRMGGRLRTQIEIDDSLRALSFPPMLLQPLVENAVVHGIEPKLGEGHVHIEVQREQDMLHIVIADDGVGFAAAAMQAKAGGQGVGLANVRERVSALYGVAARLEIKDNTPQGVRVELWLPTDAAVL